MAMAWVWTVMAAAAVIFGALTGRMAQVGAAALEGARSAVELCLSMAGVVCLWTGVMEVMERCGLAGGLARLLRPGAVTVDMLRRTLGAIEVDDAVTHRLRDGAVAASPGMKYKH